MKITLGTDDAAGHLTLVATPGMYDGRLPVPRLWVDGYLRFKNADRLCIAQALLFSSYMGGPLTFSTTCSVAVGNALRNLLAPRIVPIQSLTVEARPAPTGGRTATIGSATGAEFAVGLAPEGRFRTVYDTDRAIFASNLRTLRRPHDTDFMLELALSILFAEDLDLRQISINRADAPNVSKANLNALREAMRLTNLALTWMAEG